MKIDLIVEPASRFINAVIKMGGPRLKPEERHRRIPAVFILVATIITMTVFIPYHLFSGNLLIAAGNMVALSASIMALIYLRFAERGIFAYWIISLTFITLCIITVVIGRNEISYFLWALAPPAVFFSILGKRWGMTISLLFFAAAVALMTLPESLMASKPYPLSVLGRYTTIYMILTFMLYYYESSQQLLYQYIRREKEKFEYASKRDPLTDLANRRELVERMKEEQRRQMRSQKTFTLILGDIDDFKNMNDTYGHDAGDHILKKVAQVLKDEVRGIDCPCRWGGEEFLIMLIETSIDNGKTVAERIRNKIEKNNFSFHGTPIPITMTFGLSQFQGVNDTLDSCIKRADKALYEGKRLGKNRVISR